MSDTEWPERLRLRNTRLRDDLGGAGQRIFTTAGQGYEKKVYVRADVASEMEEKAVMRFAVTLRHKWKVQGLDEMNAFLRDVAEGNAHIKEELKR